MTQKQAEHSRPPNPWDVVIGYCYGAQVTCLVLRLAEEVGAIVMIGGQLVFLVGIALQLTRLWQARLPREPQAGGPISEPVPYLRAKQEAIDLLIGLFLGVQLTFLFLSYAGLYETDWHTGKWGHAASFIAIGLIVLRNWRLNNAKGD